MEKQTVNMYLAANAKYFESSAIPSLRIKLEKASEEAYATLQAVELKDPTTLIIISILLGSFGIDRFMLGEVGMGILKLLTGGVCGILTIYDWCTIMKKVRQANLAAVSMVL